MTVNNMYAGGFLHADDIRTLASSTSTLEEQISTVQKFTEENFLKLNASKCEIVSFKTGPSKPKEERITVGECSFPVVGNATCLGYLWKEDLSSTHAVQIRVQKARKAYFQFGSIYAFQSKLSPISCGSIVETCVLPILLYGVENWVLSPESIRTLESFQGEIAKKILHLPKWYSNTAAIIALGWNSLHSICTIRKLRFLHRVMTNEESICHRAFSALVDDVESMSLVRECRELEMRYSTNFTSAILCTGGLEGHAITKKAQKVIVKKDQVLLLEKASKYPSLIQIAEGVGWKRLWDEAIDHGPSVIKGLKNLLRVITYPDYSSAICPLCDTRTLDNPSLIDHVIQSHTKSESPWSLLLDSMCALDPQCFNHVLCLLNIF